MKTLPIHPNFVPGFTNGQEVWFITSRREVESDQVRSVFFKSMRSDGQEKLLCTGYQLSMTNPDAVDEETFSPRDLYKTKAVAQQLAVWHSVEGIREDEWLQAIGDREEETIEDYELGICCTGLSDVRDLLTQCQQDGGLIERDCRRITALLKGSGHSDKLDITDCPKPILIRIFEQLGVVSASQET